MNDSDPPGCPHCGSRQLIATQNARRVFLSPAGKYIPLLTINHLPNRPVIEKSTTIYSCSCSWSGSDEELLQP